MKHDSRAEVHHVRLRHRHCSNVAESPSVSDIVRDVRDIVRDIVRIMSVTSRPLKHYHRLSGVSGVSRISIEQASRDKDSVQSPTKPSSRRIDVVRIEVGSSDVGTYASGAMFMLRKQKEEDEQDAETATLLLRRRRNPRSTTIELSSSEGGVVSGQQDLNRASRRVRPHAWYRSIARMLSSITPQILQPHDRYGAITMRKKFTDGQEGARQSHVRHTVSGGRR